jgi:predicted PurR-regulated permease PerM
MDPMSANEPPQEPSLTPRQEAIGLAKWQKLLTVTATLLALIALCAISIRLGTAIHHTLLLFALGGLVAYALNPLVELLRRPIFRRTGKPLSRTASASLVFTGLFAIFVGGVWWLGGQAAHQMDILQKDAPSYQARAIAMAHDLDENVLKPRGIDFNLEEALQHPPPEVISYEERVSKEALPIIAHTLTNVAESAVVMLIALYFLIFGSDMKERANHALSPFLLKYAEPWEKDVNRILGGFVRGQLLLALITGASSALVLLAIGVHLWLIIGIFMVAASLIPVFGPYIGAVPAIVAALVGPTHLTPVAGAITVAVLLILINEVVSKILYPKFVGGALNLHEVLVLFVLFAGLEIGGITGTLFAAPVTSLAVVTLVHLYRMWQELPEESIADANDIGRPGLRIFKGKRRSGH